MTALFIRHEQTGAAWRVWPQADPIPPGVIQETASYIFELSGETDAASADLAIDDTPLEALRTSATDQARWRWSPGFHAGVVDVELKIRAQAPRRFKITTDPDRRKLSRDDFDGMVREILEDTFALLSLSGFRKGVSRGPGHEPPIARLEFLRSRIEELEEVVAAIVRSPRRHLSAEDLAVPYYQARRVTGPEILKSIRSGRLLRETASSARLPAVLKRHLPETIRVRRRRSSLDIPEHRQMRAALLSWSSWLGSAASFLSRASGGANGEMRTSADAWAARCRALSMRVDRLTRKAPFAEAGTAPARPVTSALFRNDPNYRSFYRLWQDMNVGLAAVLGDFLNVPLARTFELYELWCFLRLVRAMTESSGTAGLDVRELFLEDARGGVTIAAGAVTVPVGGGWKLCFQKKYREFWVETGGEGSYSRTMTPDIVVAGDGGQPGRLIVLDAKYRIDDGLNDALSSIHTYRDALVREAASGLTEGIVNAAYLVTPHEPTLMGGYRQTPMPGRLFHPEYRKGFRFGAVTLRPGMSSGEIVTTLKHIVADAVSSG